MSEKLPEGFVLNEQANALPPGFVLNQPAAPAKMSEAQQWTEAAKNVGSAAARPVVQAIASLPLMAMDTGVAARNLVTNLSRGVMPTFADFNPFASTGGSPQPNELPSRMFNRSLNTITREPQGIGQAAELVSTILLGSRVPGPQAAQQAPQALMPRVSAQDPGLPARPAPAVAQSDDTARAIQFARENNVPFPLSSSDPKSAAARVQTAARGLLPGEIRTQVDANRVSHFLNQQVATLVDDASPVDDAALKGQQYLRQVFAPGETVYTETFKNLRGTLGDDTPVKLTETRKVMESVSEALKQRGEMKSVFNRIRNVLKAAPEEQTVAQLDELYSGLLKDTARNANARREANAVLSAIGKDIDEVAEGFGVSFSDDIAKAKAVRDQFRELRNIPQLERLSKAFGEKGGTLGSRQWMSELFANPNGKALAELRSRNPEIYHELADSWLASNINRFSKPIPGSIGRALDGSAFRSWFEQNQATLKLVLGAPQTRALDNFSIYAKHMAGAVERSISGGGKFSEPLALFGRGAAEAKAAVAKPLIMIPGEVASYALAKGLSNPNSPLFKLFTDGVSPATKSFAVKSSAFAATQARTKSDGEDSR